MTTDLFKELDIGSIGENDTVDLDLIAGKLEALAAEVETYRASIIRHINARRDLLGKNDPPENSQTGIPQLLEIRDKLDQEFRERFRINGDFLPQSITTGDLPGISRFYTSGR